MDVDSEQSDEQNEQEIVFLYGKIREIIRGPAVNDPDDVLLLPKVVKVNAERNKETLSPSTVVKEPPTVENAVDSNNSTNQGGKECDTRTTSQSQVDEGKKDDGAPTSDAPMPSRRSEAADRAGKAACARAANIALYQTQSNIDSSNNSSTTDAKHMPSFASAPEVPELNDSMDNLSQTTLVIDDADLVVARRTTPMYSRGTSPWITGDCQDPPSSDAATAGSDSNISQSVAPRLLSLHNQQNQNIKPSKRSGKDHTSFLSRLPRPTYVMSTADRPAEAAVNQTEQSFIVGHVAKQPQQSSLLLSTSSTSSPPYRLASCLKYSSNSALSSTQNNSNPQRHRRIRFASEVKQQS